MTELINKGLLEPSTFLVGAPMLFVDKKDGALCMFIDYRALNSLTFREDIVCQALMICLINYMVQSTSQVWMLPQSFTKSLKGAGLAKDGIQDSFGDNQFKVLPFGLTNALASFQTGTNRLFNPLQLTADGAGIETHLSNFTTVFIDDILVFSKTAVDKHAQIVLDIWRRHEVYLGHSRLCTGAK